MPLVFACIAPHGEPIIPALASITERHRYIVTTRANMPLDWGTLVPLWFFIRGHRGRPNLVVVTPSREIPLAENLRFGALMYSYEVPAYYGMICAAFRR